MRGGTGGRRIPQDGGGGDRGAGKKRDGKGKTRGTEEEEQGTTEATETTVKGRRGRLDDPSEQKMNAGAWGKYRMGVSETEESADKSAKWGGEDTEESALEEEAVTAMEAGEARQPLTATAGDVEESRVDGGPGSAAAGRGVTREATSAAADEAGAGGRHGAKTAARERVAGWWENPAGESYGVGGRGKGREVYGVATKPSGVRGYGGGREAYRVAENPRGDRQGLGGGS